MMKMVITDEQIRQAIIAFRVNNSRFPSKKTLEPVHLNGHVEPITWSNIDFCLRRGGRGLPGTTTLARIVEEVAGDVLTVDELSQRHDRQARLEQRKLVRQNRTARRKVEMTRLFEQFGDRSPKHASVRVGSYEDLLESQRDLDAIITDPPYEHHAIPMYVRLAELAARALKPDGILAVMTGQMTLPEILGPMSAHLRFRWVLAYYNKGGNASVRSWKYRILSAWYPVVLFGGGDHRWVRDVVPGIGLDRRFHDHGKSVEGARHLVESLVSPGSLVCDPFCGGGSLGIAAVQHGCRFVGGDINPECVEITRLRLLHAEHEDPNPPMSSPSWQDLSSSSVTALSSPP